MRAMCVVALAPCVAIAVLTTACAPKPGTVAPMQAFRSRAEALDCARSALASAGFFSETRMSGPPGARPTATETPTFISARIVTPLGTGRQIDYATAIAYVKVGPQRDTTVTLGVGAGTLVSASDGLNASAEVRPLSSVAVRGRDAVVSQCSAAIEHSDYPSS
jgi:hypothetical protein